MDLSKIYDEHGVPFIVGLIISYALEKLLIESLFFTKVYPWSTLMVVITWIFIYSILNYSKSLKYPLLAFAGVFGLYFVGIGQRIIPILKFLRYDYFMMTIKWGLTYANGTTRLISMGSDFYFAILICFIISLTVGIVIKHKKSSFLMMLPGLIFVLEWSRYIDGVIKYFNIYLAGLIVYAFYRKFHVIADETKARGDVLRFFSYDSMIGYGVVMALVVVLLSNTLLLFTPISVINQKIGNRVPNISGLRSDYPQSQSAGSVFTFSSTMYQPNDYLGGTLRVNYDDSVMLVDSEIPNLRLRGRVKAKYTGNQWINENLSYKNNISDENLFDKLTEEDNEELIKTKIYATNIATTTIFSPYRYVTSDAHTLKIFGNDDQITFFKRGNFQSNPSEYTVISKPDYVEMMSINDDALKQYLKLPDNYSQKVRVLTNNITQGIDDPYLKVKAIERYLRENYNYSLIVGNVSQFDDFVENFLFEEDQGYCVYFASAMAVMGRVAGVPTRYVEGFILPDKRNFDGLYDVTGDRAHAWVEAYIPEKGWITLEATPAYTADLLEETETEENTETNEEPVVPEDNKETEIRDPFEEEIDEGFGDGVRQVKIDGNLVLLLIILLSLILMIVINLIGNKKRQDLYQVMPHRGKGIVLIKRIIRYLDAFKVLDSKKVLPTNFIQRMTKQQLYFVVSDDIIEIIDRTLYSSSEISKEDVSNLDEFYQSVAAGTKDKMNFFRYYVAKFFVQKLL